jgi:hypothetical protein
MSDDLERQVQNVIYSWGLTNSVTAHKIAFHEYPVWLARIKLWIQSNRLARFKSWLDKQTNLTTLEQHEYLFWYEDLCFEYREAIDELKTKRLTKKYKERKNYIKNEKRK